MKNNLKTLRTQAGFSLDELGKLCGGKSRAQIHQLEKDSANPLLSTAYVIAGVLNVDVTDIWPNEIEIILETTTVRRLKVMPKQSTEDMS
jgi:DNA-binding XRE family transcriptional regulator